MPNLGDRPKPPQAHQQATGTPSARGRARRTELLDAAVAQLTDGGWLSVTTRAVAARAGANPALVHYYFGSVDELRRAAAGHAVDQVFGRPTTDLLAARPAARAQVAVAALEAADGRTLNVLTALFDAAARDETTRIQLSETRTEFRAAGTALLGDAAAVTALTAALDGLLLHRLVDPDLDVAPAVRWLFHALDRGPAPAA